MRTTQPPRMHAQSNAADRHRRRNTGRATVRGLARRRVLITFLCLLLVALGAIAFATWIDATNRTQARIARAWRILMMKDPGSKVGFAPRVALEYLNSASPSGWPKKRIPLNLVNLSSARHGRPVDIRMTRLPRAQLSRANLQGTRMSMNVLDGADLSRANLEAAVLQGSTLRSANLTEANLREARMLLTNLQGAVLRGASLQGADLRNARLRQAVLNDADLQGANLSRAQLEKADLEGADLRGANLTRAGLQSADLENARLAGADLAAADIRDALNLSCAALQTAKNWERALRDERLACGSSIPRKQDSTQDRTPSARRHPLRRRRPKPSPLTQR